MDPRGAQEGDSMNGNKTFSPYGLDLFGNPITPPGLGPLAQRFSMPPFSVFNAREGEWQSRKDAWLSLGIKSELGRGENLLGFSDTIRAIQAGHNPADRKNVQGPEGGVLYQSWSGWDPQFYYKKKEAEAKLGRELSTEEFLEKHYVIPTDQDSWLGSGSSIFDPVLTELIYHWFCPEEGQIIDPFSGGSVRGIVAAMMGRSYWGCDLAAAQIEANKKQAAEICPVAYEAGRLRWWPGDALERISEAPEADLLFSCPPYGNLEVYSNDPRDLSMMGIDKFTETYWKIIGRAAARLRPDSFACFVVGDYRDKKTGAYQNFVSSTIQGFLNAGLKLYNEAILVVSCGSMAIRLGKQFATTRKMGKVHQNVLVFLKGDGKRATARLEDLGAPGASREEAQEIAPQRAESAACAGIFEDEEGA
jgi:DNA modification methylase